MYDFWMYVIVYIKTDDIYKEIAEDLETRFNTSNCNEHCLKAEMKR